MTTPRISHPTKRPNFTQYEDGHGLTIWFSYETPIVFHTTETGYVARVSEWGPTTARHYSSALPSGHDRSSRIPGAEFVRLLESLTR